MKKIFILVLTFFVGFIANSHEISEANLLIEIQNGNTRVMLQVPSQSTTQPTLSLKFPEDWNKISASSTYLNGQYLSSYVFEGELNSPQKIGIVRSVDNRSPLVVREKAEGRSEVYVISHEQSEFELMEAKPPVFTSFVWLGMEHIWIGIDHLLFVLALVFLVKRKQLLWAITSFTLAHSITLALATLDLFVLPISVVEALIAFSVLLLAVEMTRSQGLSKNYLSITFGFGLLHGFGFASVLGDLGLPSNNKILALFSFNLGVELGQVIFVLVLLGVGWLVKKITPSLSGQRPIAYILGSVASFWFVERCFAVFV